MATDSKTVQGAFGEVLRQVRIGRGLSQQDLALDAELDRTYVSLLERGRRQPTLTTLIMLARALDTDAAALVEQTTILLSRNSS